MTHDWIRIFIAAMQNVTWVMLLCLCVIANLEFCCQENINALFCHCHLIILHWIQMRCKILSCWIWMVNYCQTCSLAYPRQIMPVREAPEEATVQPMFGAADWPCAIFFRENINKYLHFMSFLHTNMTQVVEIPPRVRQGPAYSTKSISWLLMSWRCKEPGHQQPWYWPS